MEDHSKHIRVKKVKREFVVKVKASSKYILTFFKWLQLLQALKFKDFLRFSKIVQMLIRFLKL